MIEQRLTVSDVGEKTLIRDFIKPFFNADDDPRGVGDDCAMIEIADEVVLLSTDRVPADLTAFQLGILNYEGLGDYLARLNLSDIAACGGRPVGLLLNLGLPATVAYDDVKSICRGFRLQAETLRCKVLGGDITSSNELSISATSIGLAKRGRVLTRRGAKAGDSIFLSRPAGLTPAAFQYFLGRHSSGLPEDDVTKLREQFTAMTPMVELGQRLASSDSCTSCMDNTDGIGQSLSELAAASSVSFIVDEELLVVPELVAQIASQAGKEPLQFLFDGGADFSLVGTLRGQWSREAAKARFDDSIEIIGHAEVGTGVRLKRGAATHDLTFRGWNYFVQK